MDFQLQLPEPEKTADEVKKDTEVTEEEKPAYESVAEQKSKEIMAVDLDSFEDRKQIVAAIEGLGSDAVRKSSSKNSILQKRMVSLEQDGGESGEVARGLEDLSIRMRDLDPSGVDFMKKGPLGGLFNPVRRYFERYKTADQEISGIIKTLDKGRKTLEADNTTLELEEHSLRQATKELSKNMELAEQLDAALSAEIEERRAAGEDPEIIKFVEEEVLFPLRQKEMDFAQLITVNQQGIVAMNIVRQNNKELIRAVNRAENVTVSALRVAVTVAGALYNQKITLEKVKVLNETTNAMITSTARMLKEQGASIHKEATEASISVDTLKQAFADTFQALDDISTYKQEALPRMHATIEEFRELAEEGEANLRRLEAANKL